MVEITLAQQGTQLQSTQIPSVHHFTLIWILLGTAPMSTNHPFPTWYAHKTVAQTIRKQYKHTIGVFEWVSHTDATAR